MTHGITLLARRFLHPLRWGVLAIPLLVTAWTTVQPPALSIVLSNQHDVAWLKRYPGLPVQWGQGGTNAIQTVNGVYAGAFVGSTFPFAGIVRVTNSELGTVTVTTNAHDKWFWTNSLLGTCVPYDHATNRLGYGTNLQSEYTFRLLYPPYLITNYTTNIFYGIGSPPFTNITTNITFPILSITTNPFQNPISWPSRGSVLATAPTYPRRQYLPLNYCATNLGSNLFFYAFNTATSTPTKYFLQMGDFSVQHRDVWTNVFSNPQLWPNCYLGAPFTLLNLAPSNPPASLTITNFEIVSGVAYVSGSSSAATSTVKIQSTGDLASWRDEHTGSTSTNGNFSASFTVNPYTYSLTNTRAGGYWGTDMNFNPQYFSVGYTDIWTSTRFFIRAKLP